MAQRGATNQSASDTSERKGAAASATMTEKEATSAHNPALEQLRELPEFFSHAHPEVRLNAVLILQGFSVKPAGS